MPCDSITTVSIELKKADKKTLKAACEALGYTVNISSENVLSFSKGYTRGSYQDGKLIITSRYSRDTEQIGIDIKKAYSKELVKAQMQKFGWKSTTGQQKVEVGQW